MEAVAGMELGESGVEAVVENVDGNAGFQFVVGFARDGLVVEHTCEIMLGSVEEVVLVVNLHFNVDEFFVFGSHHDVHDGFFLTVEHAVDVGIEVFDFCDLLAFGKVENGVDKDE